MTTSQSPTHPDAPRAGGETPDILADLERYLDAYRDAIIAEQSAGPEYAAFDPDVDRAYERVNNLGTELRAKMAANQTAAASLLERHRDGERWRALVAVLDRESMRTPEPGALILWTMRSNQWDAPKASIQSIAWRAPSRTLWIEEAETINEAMDRVLATSSEKA